MGDLRRWTAPFSDSNGRAEGVIIRAFRSIFRSSNPMYYGDAPSGCQRLRSRAAVNFKVEFLGRFG